MKKNLLTTERHDSVMDNVQCRNLIESLPHHKENGIEEFGEFAHIVKPTGLGDL